jgi:hypothetical protein
MQILSWEASIKLNNKLIGLIIIYIVLGNFHRKNG